MSRRLTQAEEKFGGLFWRHVSGCFECRMKLDNLIAGPKGTAAIDGMMIKELAEKLCPASLELVNGFEASQPKA